MGADLARIKHIVMFACPNSGSSFLLSFRTAAGLWRHPQERELRPLNREIIESRRTVLTRVVHARSNSDTECYIPIAAYGGSVDNIAPAEVATDSFPLGGVIDGDHFSIVRPKNEQDRSYAVVKIAVRTAMNEDPVPAQRSDEMPVNWSGRAPIKLPTGRFHHPFQGRDDLLAEIAADRSYRVHVLAGPGGSGKSRLAYEIAERAERAGAMVFWIDVMRINGCMQEVAYHLRASQSQVERAWGSPNSATELAWRLLEEIEGRWLLVFDNADSPERLCPFEGGVVDGNGWLRMPKSDNGQVLVTTRVRNPATWGSWSRMHEVPPLGLDDASAMLMDQCSEAVGNYEQARLLAAELGGLPLALHAAANYLQSVNGRVWAGEQSVRNFDEFRLAVNRRFTAPPRTDQPDPQESLGLGKLAEVYDLSLDLLVKKNLAEAVPLIKLFACLGNAPIPYPVLLASRALTTSPLFPDSTSSRLSRVLEGLVELALVDMDTLPGVTRPEWAHVLTLHPVVHGILRNDDDVRHRSAEYHGTAVRMFLEVTGDFDPDYPESNAPWYLVAPHAVELARATLLGEPQAFGRGVIHPALQLTRMVGRYFIVSGLLTPARELVHAVVANCQSYGCHPDDRQILALRHEKGRIELEHGEYAAAEAELSQVVRERSRLLGPDHTDTLASRHKLAKAIHMQDRWSEAEPLLRSIVRAEHQVRGPEHADTMVVRHTLARATLALGRPEVAERMLRDILAVRLRKWPASTHETLAVQDTLARCLLMQQRPVEAEAEALDALGKTHDNPHATAALTLRYHRALALLMQDRVSEVISDLETLLADQRRILAPHHRAIEWTAGLLGRAREIVDTPSDLGEIQARPDSAAGGGGVC